MIRRLIWYVFRLWDLVCSYQAKKHTISTFVDQTHIQLTVFTRLSPVPE